MQKFNLWPVFRACSAHQRLVSRETRIHSLLVRGVKSKGIFYELGVLFSKERREQRNKALQEEVNRGRFYELNELKKTGGKLFESSEKLLPVPSSVSFPSIPGVQLLGQAQNSVEILRGKVTLVTVCLRDIARPMAISWTKPFSNKFQNDLHVQAVDIYFVEGILYKMMKGLMLSLMKRQIPKEAWKSTFVTFESGEAIRKELDMKNRLVGYVFLVDQEGRVRWKGVGYAQHHEMKSLLECAAQLAHLR